MANSENKPANPHTAPKRRPPKITAPSAEELIPFGWYSGKFPHLAWLLPLLPKFFLYYYCFDGPN